MRLFGTATRLSQLGLGVILYVLTCRGDCADLSNSLTTSGLWAHDNLFAWGAAPFDEKKREPEERAQMLERLGFKHVAFNWRDRNIATFDTEIDALKKRGIRLLAWALYVTDDAGVQQPWKDYTVESPGSLMYGRKPSVQSLTLKGLLETFKRHRVHPQLWLIQPLVPLRLPPYAQGMSPLQLSQSPELVRSVTEQYTEEWRQDLASMNTPRAQELRIEREANRIAALVKLAAPYGVRVELYNHNGWFGMMKNQLAVIERLKAIGITDVGTVYNFDHARDELHDDTVNFATLWKEIKPHVVAINVSGTHAEPIVVYPSQGDRELDMMRIVENSGWKGPVGLNTEVGGDAEVTLKNCLVGLDWLVAELRQPGAGGPRPYPPAQ